MTGMQAVAVEMEKRGRTKGANSEAPESPSPLPCGHWLRDVMKMKNEEKETGPEGLISWGVGLNYVVCQCVPISFLVPSFFPSIRCMKI